MCSVSYMLLSSVKSQKDVYKRKYHIDILKSQWEIVLKRDKVEIQLDSHVF